MKIACARLAAAVALTLALGLSGGLAGTGTAAASQASSGTVAGVAAAQNMPAVAARGPFGTLHYHRVVVFNCRHRPEVRPPTFVISCADYNNYLTHLIWFHWGLFTAFGVGEHWVNTCIPNCAAGHFVHHWEHVLLWRIEPVFFRFHFLHIYRFTRITTDNRETYDI